MHRLIWREPSVPGLKSARILMPAGRLLSRVEPICLLVLNVSIGCNLSSAPHVFPANYRGRTRHVQIEDHPAAQIESSSHLLSSRSDRGKTQGNGLCPHIRKSLRKGPLMNQYDEQDCGKQSRHKAQNWFPSIASPSLQARMDHIC